MIGLTVLLKLVQNMACTNRYILAKPFINSPYKAIAKMTRFFCACWQRHHQLNTDIIVYKNNWWITDGIFSRIYVFKFRGFTNVELLNQVTTKHP